MLSLDVGWECVCEFMFLLLDYVLKYSSLILPLLLRLLYCLYPFLATLKTTVVFIVAPT